MAIVQKLSYTVSS